MDSLIIAQFILTLCGIIGVVVGWFQSLRNRGKYEQKVEDAIIQLQEEMKSIKATIGNGGFNGIKQTLTDMKVHCAEEMTEIKTRMKNIEDRHGVKT